MPAKILILNTAVVDFRRPDFEFADRLVGPDGLAKCLTGDMPTYSQAQLHEWIQEGCATAGGFGNNGDLMAQTGLQVVGFTMLGAGDYETGDKRYSLDAQGAFFYDYMKKKGVDMRTLVHPTLPTGTTFIHAGESGGRGGIAYFPNANNEIDLAQALQLVTAVNPEIVYYMYSGLSTKGDAKNGDNLAEFLHACGNDRITIADCHTLTGNPKAVIGSGKPVDGYKLLEPLLQELSIFFTSTDEAQMIANTLASLPSVNGRTMDLYLPHFANSLRGKYASMERGTVLFGVTHHDGAFFTAETPNERIPCSKVQSNFLSGEIVDLVGAGDAFRAGVLSYVGHYMDEWFSGQLNFAEAVQMGNLFAALHIKAPLDDRSCYIRPFEKMEQIVQKAKDYQRFDELQTDLGPR